MNEFKCRKEVFADCKYSKICGDGTYWGENSECGRVNAQYKPPTQIKALIDILYTSDGQPRITLERLAELVDADEAGRCAVLPGTGVGDFSDGYHTFNELYHHRAMLFSVVCHHSPDIAWKSKKHDDGTMYDGMFIVGIDTPIGQATYHYDTNPYWELFQVKELDRAPKWDGHTPADAINRLARMGMMYADVTRWSAEAEAALK